MTVNENSKPLLTVKGLKQYFKVSNTYTVHAVENVSFQIYPGVGRETGARVQIPLSPLSVISKSFQIEGGFVRFMVFCISG